MNYINSYASFLKSFLKANRPLKVIFDCSNGTTGLVLKELFKTYKLVNFKLISCKLDGNFPAHGPNPSAKGATRQLEKEIKKQKADLGVIFDADGDRVFFVDDLGRLIEANKTGYILMKEFKPSSFAVGSVSGWLLKKQKGAVISRVGHYFFKKLMREKKISLGLEHSGHFYFSFPEFGDAVWDSGIVAALKIINFVSCLNQPLSDYLDSLPKYYQSGEINFKIRDKAKILKKVEKAYRGSGKINKLDGLTMNFPDYWFNLRPSNTENLLRLNLEADNKKTFQQELKSLKRLIKN